MPEFERIDEARSVAFGDRADSLAQRAYRAIRQSIKDGRLAGDHLYSESELAASMGISRTPVREALIELAREGLVEIAPQRGFRLRALGREEQREVFDLRYVLEPFVAERLARQASRDHVEQLAGILRRQRGVLDDADAFLEVDEEFHLLMPRLIHLERTHEMMLTLRGAMWLMGVKALELPERAPDALAEHEAVLAAISSGDAAAAAEAARRHVHLTGRAVERTEGIGDTPPHARRVQPPSRKRRST